MKKEVKEIVLLLKRSDPEKLIGGGMRLNIAEIIYQNGYRNKNEKQYKNEKTNKKQQIEELYNILNNDKNFNGTFSKAKFIYNAGYRKVVPNVDYIVRAGELVTIRETAYNDARKETAKEILQKLYKHCFEIADPYGDDEEPYGDVTPDDIKNLAKIYGVEVE